MSRPRTIRTERILEAARALFLERGYGVSTAEIARAADVSEGTLFKRFATKSALFGAAMGLPDIDLAPVVARLVGARDVRTNLTELGGTIVAFFRTKMPRLMMLWAQPALNPLDALKDCGGSASPQRMLKDLALYLEREQNAGRLRGGVDAAVAARMLIGALHSFVFFEVVEGAEADPERTRALVAAAVDVLWEGIRP